MGQASVAKNEKPTCPAFHDVLFEAVLAALPPRQKSDLDAPPVPRLPVGANLRTSITRACKATGSPHFSPHGLRKRRGSLLSKQGYSLAEISERLGDTKVVTAEHYLYALGDYTEVDYAVSPRSLIPPNTGRNLSCGWDVAAPAQASERRSLRRVRCVGGRDRRVRHPRVGLRRLARQ